MGFLDFPFAAGAAGSQQDLRRFPGHEEVLQYLEAFVRWFDLLRLVRFETEVVRVRRGNDGRWAVTSRKLGEKRSGAGEELFYDAVVICNGHYMEPRIVAILGTIYRHDATL
jgi:cation diffusion facilitator CzcD-associated flavoprotein CzcO